MRLNHFMWQTCSVFTFTAPRVTGMNLQKGFFGNCFIFNDIVAKQNYRKHNADVIQVIVLR